MRILHCCLSNYYIDNYKYQENILPKIHKAHGHDVLIIASTETFINNIDLSYVNPESYYTEYGVPIIRVPYKRIINKFITVKFRKYIGVYQLVGNFNPDVILFHGIGAYELLTLAKYIKKHPNVKLYVDNHGDYHNSASNFLSKEILHKLFYKQIIKRALPYINKILYLTYENKEFLKNLYKIPENKLEYYPLGGIIISEMERCNKRDKIRSILKANDEDIILLHSGKMDKLKRTEEIVKALSHMSNQHVKLVLIGSMTDDVKEKLLPYIQKDQRIMYLGWKSSEELLDYICASDLYIQPGGQSVTMQAALCCGVAVALYPFESHKFLLKDSVFYIKDHKDIKKLLELIIDNPAILEEKRKQSYSIACEKLDYKILAQRICQ